MKKPFLKVVGCVLAGILVLSGCSPSVSLPDEGGTGENVAVLKDRTVPFDFSVDPETFELSFQVKDQEISVSEKSEKRVVKNYTESENTVSWNYPDENIQVELSSKENYMEVQISSEEDGDNAFTWPHVAADQYYLPLGEGKRVPADDDEWISYLAQREVTAMEQLSMPLWISEKGDYCVMFIMENPYRTRMEFSAQPKLEFSVAHEYPEIDENKTNSYRIYVTENDPADCAKIYRNYVKEKGAFVTLSQKAQDNPDIEKLYGAPFIYLWGDNVISEENINWEAFRQALDSPVMAHLKSFSGDMENGIEYENVLTDVRGQDYVAEYQKNVICSYISQALMRDDFWNPEIFTEISPQMDELLSDRNSELTASEKLKLHKWALAANLPEVFCAASDWMNASTVDLLRDMQSAGIDRAWIGLNSWEQAYAKPELVEQAAAAGYLIASYDSYHSIHEPGAEQWITAQFDDTSLYENATVTKKDGTKESGFKNVGRKLNPVCSMSAVKSRMEEIMSNDLPFNSWFIDCDATGEIYDDYTPGHITTQEQDLAARLERMAYIRDNYGLVIGSEGGNDFAAGTIAYAHGIELPSFSWMDEDMKANTDSEYYIGKYYNPTGGVAEHFAKRIPVKEKYYSIFVDPRYDVPLFKLVYNDSVLTAAHWDWSTFKIKGATGDRMIREILYNVSPLYHLDRTEWEEFGEDIAAHHQIWSFFSREAVEKEMTDFEYLEKDGTVQRTEYGNSLTVVANFSDTVYSYRGTDIAAHSVLIEKDGTSLIYMPKLSSEHK